MRAKRDRILTVAILGDVLVGRMVGVRRTHTFIVADASVGYYEEGKAML